MLEQEKRLHVTQQGKDQDCWGWQCMPSCCILNAVLLNDEMAHVSSSPQIHTLWVRPLAQLPQACAAHHPVLPNVPSSLWPTVESAMIYHI